MSTYTMRKDARQRAAFAAAAAKARDAYLALPSACHAQDLADQLQVFPIDLLVALAAGGVNLQLEMKRSLADRGLNVAGEWVGFATAEHLIEDEVLADNVARGGK